MCVIVYNNIIADETVGLSSWSQWSTCSVSCGGGLTSRTRMCTDGTYTCSAALYGDRFNAPLPFQEFKSCLYDLCGDKLCSGN